MKRLDLIVFIVITLGLGELTGCGSDKLTRGKAKDILIKELAYPQETKGRICSSHRVKINSKKSAEQMKFLYKKEKLIMETGKRINYRNYFVMKVSLTKKAQKYVVGKEIIGKTECSFVKLAERKFGKVTGIKFSKNDKEALVEYNWSYVKLTPFGKNWDLFDNMLFKNPFNRIKKIVEKRKYNEKIILELYDDGWRITSFVNNSF